MSKRAAGCGPLWVLVCLLTIAFAIPVTAQTPTPTPPLTPTANPACGNGSVQAGEQCDDFNIENGDGCAHDCRVEPCWSCSGEPSVCSAAAEAVTVVDASADVGQYTSVAIGADSFPTISYYDATNQSLKVADCRDAACSDRFIVTVDTGDVGKFNAIAIGADGFPIIAYRATGGALKVAHCNDPTCSAAATISSYDHSLAGHPLAILIGSGGLPLIAESIAGRGLAGSFTALQILSCADAACTGGSLLWVDRKDGIQGGQVGLWPAAVLGSNGVPLVVYGKTGLTPDFGQMLVRCTTGSCADASLSRIHTVSSSANTIAVGVDGFALTGSRDPDRSLRTLHCNNLNCSSSSSSIVRNDGAVGDFIRLARGSDDRGVLAYFDQTALDLRLAYCNDLACSSVTTRTIDQAGDVGRYLSMAIGADGAPIVSYYDATNATLKVARICPSTVGCGNGSVEAGENCDDGNSLDGDSCPSSCWIEGYTPPPTSTRTDTPSRTITSTPTPTLSGTPTRTPTITRTPTSTPVPSATPTDTSTVTPTATDTATETPSPTATETATRTDTPTRTPTWTRTNTPTRTPTPTCTPTMSPTELPSETPTDSPTAPADTPTQTVTATETATASETSTPTETSTPVQSASPTLSPTPTHSPVAIPTETATASETSTPTETSTPAQSASPTLSPTPTHSPVVIPTETATATPPVSCGEGPRTGCREAAAASLMIKNNDGNARDSILWKWSGGPETLVDDFAAGQSGAIGYRFCVYDEIAGEPQLVVNQTTETMTASCGALPCWKQTSKGFRYRAKSTVGSFELQLTARPGGRASIKLKEKGHPVRLPEPQAADRFFAQDAAVLVQLANSDDSACWQATFPAAAVRSAAGQFFDKAP